LGRIEGAVEAAMLEVFHACRDIRVKGSPLRRRVLIGKVAQYAAFTLKAFEALTEEPAQAAIGFPCQSLSKLKLGRGQRDGNGFRGSHKRVRAG
jgi:hypothetical protein